MDQRLRLASTYVLWTYQRGGSLSLRSRALTAFTFPYPSPLQTLLDMVENYPTQLCGVWCWPRTALGPELQQQICDLPL